jgi:hypothetical protein
MVDVQDLDRLVGDAIYQDVGLAGDLADAGARHLAEMSDEWELDKQIDRMGRLNAAG